MKNLIIFFLVILLQFSYSQNGKKYNVSVNSEMTIGGDTEDQNQQLAFPYSVAVDDIGNIFILDIKLREIKKFDKSGKFITTFGKNGEGPGEFNYSGGRTPKMTVYNNQLYVYDDQVSQITVFSNDCKYLKTIKTERGVKDLVILKDGSFLSNFNINPKTIGTEKKKEKVIDGKDGASMIKGLPSFEFIFICNNNNEPIKLLDSLETIGGRIIMGGGTIQLIKESDFDCRMHYNSLPNGNIVVANSATNKLKIFDNKGKLIQSIDCKTDQIKIPEREFDNFYEKRKITSASIQNELKKSFPTFYPYFQKMIVDGNGNIFLQTSINEKDSNIFDIYSQDGKYLDRVKLPKDIASQRFCFKNGYLYQITGGKDDFAAIKKYKLTVSQK